MLPNLFVIGAAKAGTTALHEYLGLHPEIHMSALKEPNYFAPEDASPVGHRHSILVRDRDEYEALFDSTAPLRGESSPAYSQYPRRPGVPERISRLVPEARFIYVVRDPIERIVAFHVQRASRGEYGSLSEAIGDIADPRNDYVCPSRYMTQLERYMRHFDAERILVVDQHDLRHDRAATLRRIFGFLGAEPAFWTPAFEHESNRSVAKRAYNRSYARLAGSSVVRKASAALPDRVELMIRHGASRVLKPRLELPVIDPGLRRRLEELLAPEAERLRVHTGQDFASWSV